MKGPKYCKIHPDMWVALSILVFLMFCYFLMHENWLSDLVILIIGVIAGALRASLDPHHLEYKDDDLPKP